ncbi:peptidoglycan-binding domain-containing protein [Kitasatospora mediocidica]|uniref:peptidoglycan-binding domain-containing protein n=1 Tax=Kitasatospora mediocidica TaxID=58352 RepID=UPI000689A0F7|nr:peptidoglycan-binding domain-containing protein [Kitasatospora mediocidica]
MVGAGAGVVALGVGLAFALGSPPDVQHDALVPLPTSVPDQAPTGAPTPPPTSAPPTLAPSSPPATSAKPSASASRSRPAARPTTQTPVSVTSAPAPSAPAPSSAPPSPSSPPPSPSAAPSTSAPAQTLSYSDRGPQVTTLQHQLMTAGCGRHLNSGVYDDATEQAVVLLQEENQLWQDQWGVYGPQTRAALESGTTC